jgi:hypothetical protein
VLQGPFFLVGDLYFVDRKLTKLRRRLDWNRQPAPALLSSNLVPVREAVLLELRVIEHNMHIRNRDAMKVS